MGIDACRFAGYESSGGYKHKQKLERVLIQLRNQTCKFVLRSNRERTYTLKDIHTEEHIHEGDMYDTEGQKNIHTYAEETYT